MWKGAQAAAVQKSHCLSGGLCRHDRGQNGFIVYLTVVQNEVVWADTTIRIPIAARSDACLPHLPGPRIQ